MDTPNFIPWFPLPFDLLGKMCIAICPVCDVINFEINRSFLIEPFFYITKGYIEKGFAVVKSCLRPQSGDLKICQI